MKEEDKLNLYSKHEAYLLSQATLPPTEIPACVVTGFLGSGKTTLVSHLLRNRGGLRIAVLINEVGQVDLDSQLVDQGRVHAALGAASTLSLSGGCVCCTAAGDLETSLQALRTASIQQGAAAAGAKPGTLDYLIIETSGVSDAEPLAGALTRQGYRLESVVAVVDAEAGKQALNQPVAQAQLRCADVVVINKCDIASLGDTADVEDAVQQLSPGVRMIRARYGQVPLPYLMDVEEEEPVQGVAGTQPGSAGAAAAPGVVGEVGFLSHEAQVTNTGPRYRVTGRYSKIAKQPIRSAAPSNPSTIAAVAAAGPHDASHDSCSHTHDHHHHDDHHHHHLQAAQQEGHAQLHANFHTVSAHAEAPISLAAFQHFVTILTLIPGMYRAKGIIWLKELRSHRYIFHLSGRQRVECLQAEPWTSPPSTQLVLIGDAPDTLDALRCAFIDLLQPGAPSSADASHNQLQKGGDGVVQVLLKQLQQLHERLEVQQQTSCGAPVLSLQVKGEPLHGVRGSEVNAAVFRRMNAALHEAGHLLLGVPEVPTISATHGQSTHGLGERLQSCLLLPDATNPILQLRIAAQASISAKGQCAQSRPAVCGHMAQRLLQLLPEATRQGLLSGAVLNDVLNEGSQEPGADDVGRASDLLLKWVWQAVGPAMRKAFPHTGCRCDVVALMHST